MKLKKVNHKFVRPGYPHNSHWLELKERNSLERYIRQ